MSGQSAQPWYVQLIPAAARAVPSPLFVLPQMLDPDRIVVAMQ